MTPKQKAIIDIYGKLLKEKRDFSYKDIADQLNITERSISPTIRYLKLKNEWPYETRKNGRPFSMKPTDREQKIIGAYEQLIRENKEPSVANITELIYGEVNRHNKANVHSSISYMKKVNRWPYTEESNMNTYPALSRVINPNINRNKDVDIDEDKDVWALKNTVRLLNTLKSPSMKKVIEAIKNGAYTTDEMYVLTELSKIFAELNDEERDLVFTYIGAKFKL